MRRTAHKAIPIAGVLLVSWQLTTASADPTPIPERIAQIKTLLDAGRYRDAVPLARALAADSDGEPTDAGVHAKVLQLLGRSEFEVGNYPEAQLAEQKALPLAQATYGAGSEQEASINGDLAASLRHLGKLDEAEATFAAAVKAFAALPAPNEGLFADVLINYAVLAHDRGDLPRAAALTADALTRRRVLDPPKPAAVAQALDNLGTILQEEGFLAEAQRDVAESLALRQKFLPVRHPDIAASLNDLGVLEQQRGEYASAKQHFEEASGIDSDTYGSGDPQVLLDLSNLGEVLHSMDQPDKALEIELAVLAGREAAAKRSGADATPLYDLAVSNGNIANLMRDLGRGNEAMKYYERALALDRERGKNEPTVDVALDLNNLGEALREDGRWAEAESALQDGVGVAQKVGAPARRTLATLYHNAGALAEDRNDLAAAEQNLRKAADLRVQALPADHPDLALSRSMLADVLSKEGLPSAAAEAELALRILESRSERTNVGLSAAMVAAEARSSRKAVERLLSVYARAAAQPHDVLDGARADRVLAALHILQETGTAVVAARAASALLASDRTAASKLRQIEDLRDRREQIASAEARVAAGIPTDPHAVRSASSAELDGEIEALVAQLPPRVSDLIRTPKLQFATIHEKLADGEGWIGFAVGDKNTIVILITVDGVRIAFSPKGRSTIAADVKALREQLNPEHPTDFDTARSRALYTTLFAAFGASFERLSKLVIASDGPLESIPMAVLVTGPEALNPRSSYQDTQWLSDRATIVVTPSLSTVIALRTSGASPPSTRGFVGFGDPVLGPPQSMSDDASAEVFSKLLFTQGAPGTIVDVKSLPSLPQSERQLTELNTLFGGGNGLLITGQAATKNAVMTADLSAYETIAFATHGLLAAENPTGEPALVLTPSGSDNGLLTAAEVAGLRLSAGLVVLSACNTAAPKSEFGSDGLSGLARAFFHAGARSVLISHWPVDAQATTEYLALLGQSKGLDASQAFNVASKRLRAKPGFSHPAYWAPFDLIGGVRELLLP